MSDLFTRISDDTHAGLRAVASSADLSVAKTLDTMLRFALGLEPVAATPAVAKAVRAWKRGERP